jgi:hypothetical protein
LDIEVFLCGFQKRGVDASSYIPHNLSFTYAGIMTTNHLKTEAEPTAETSFISRACIYKAVPLHAMEALLGEEV